MHVRFDRDVFPTINIIVCLCVRIAITPDQWQAPQILRCVIYDSGKCQHGHVSPSIVQLDEHRINYGYAGVRKSCV